MVYKKDRYESDTISEIESVEEVYEELDFENCVLSLVKFTKCSFSTLTFIKTKLIGIDWYDTFRFSLTMKCYGCVINFSSFVNVKLKSFVLEECTAHEVDFSEADMHNACCKGTDFQGSIFRRSNLSGADFTGAKNYTINPAHNNVKKARFSLPEVLSLLAETGILIADEE